MPGIIDIGIGSWADPEYVGVLYPKGLPSSNRLAHYATHFDHVEVNSSYYSTPRRSVVEQWNKQTPVGFRFEVKLHRAFTRSPAKVAEDGKLLKLLLNVVAPLIKAKKLGAFLLTLAPDYKPDRHSVEELDVLVEKLRPHPLAVEFRHSAWVAGKQRERTLDYFRARKITWVAVDMPRIRSSTLMPVLDEVTDPRLAYLRLHGRNPKYLEAESAAERHTFLYSDRQLRELATRTRKLAAKAERVVVVANNHARDYAPRTALALKALLA